MSSSSFNTSTPKKRNSSEARKSNSYFSLKDSTELYKTENAKKKEQDDPSLRKSNSLGNSSANSSLQRLDRTRSFTPGILEELAQTINSSGILNIYI